MQLTADQEQQLLQNFIDLTKAVSAGGATLAKGNSGGGGIHGEEGAYAPKSFFNDPFQYLDHLGIGFKDTPSELTYGTLKAMSERDMVIAAIIQTRQNQVASFCARPKNKFSVGFRVRHKNRKRKLTEGDRNFIHDTEEFLLRCGHDTNDERDDFETFIRKITRDSLRYDQANFEIIPRMNGQPHHFLAVDAASIRFARPKRRKGGPSVNNE